MSKSLSKPPAARKKPVRTTKADRLDHPQPTEEARIALAQRVIDLLVERGPLTIRQMKAALGIHGTEAVYGKSPFATFFKDHLCRKFVVLPVQGQGSEEETRYDTAFNRACSFEAFSQPKHTDKELLDYAQARYRERARQLQQELDRVTACFTLRSVSVRAEKSYEVAPKRVRKRA